ncbi:hypothetical protein [Actinoalloteichus hymeniacidonis]|uniref:Uncharacterized protein n=1 Tax=Actinoalloteichus hymeniacidonis TaxID=340345 RepID=A0AAC9HPP5_9PSEU|nr:hypothetical protein [Actinoalloteichus hymeniacidonis]AOS63038.1 hypothetical protein TL08_11120 [Actinoalloteichus hymeniacidonis]MBB5908927.1 hypothetical protein [Actinoalloteichus hymeniacidonis]
MSHRNTVVRAVHDVGLAAWFGGSLMGAVGLTGASEESSSATERIHIVTAGWRRWAPFNALAIGTHLLGGIALTRANRQRIAEHRSVAASSAVKAALTGLALAATVYSKQLGRRLDEMTDQPSARGDQEADQVDPEMVALQQRLRMVQWAVPLLTGAIEVVNALHGEQQRGERHHEHHDHHRHPHRRHESEDHGRHWQRRGLHGHRWHRGHHQCGHSTQAQPEHKGHGRRCRGRWH